MLKYGFCKKSLRKNATLTSWTLFSSQKGTCSTIQGQLQTVAVLVLYRYLFVKKNVFNLPELHFSEVTFYKIHTLIIIRLGLLVVDYFVLPFSGWRNRPKLCYSKRKGRRKKKKLMLQSCNLIRTREMQVYVCATKNVYH